MAGLEVEERWRSSSMTSGICEGSLISTLAPEGRLSLIGRWGCAELAGSLQDREIISQFKKENHDIRIITKRKDPSE